MATPSPEDIKKIETYMARLDVYRKKKKKPMDHDLLVDSADMWLRIIDKLGGGDPLKAAHVHAMTMAGIREDITAGKLNADDYPDALTKDLDIRERTEDKG